MEMNALYLDTNSMFNFDELYARIHELDGIKEPSDEFFSSDELETYIEEIEQDGLAVGSANYSTDLGEWRE